MKKLLIGLILVFPLISIGAPLRVTIDPGHGGEDQGAFHGGIAESSVALQIAKKVFRKLSKDKKFKAQLIRHSDKEISLEDRVANTKKFKPDLFLSIHANAHPTIKNAKGAEFYIQNQLEVDEEISFLAHNEFGKQAETKPKISGDVDSIVYDLQKSQRILESYQVSSFLRKNWSTGKKKRMIRQGPFFVLTQNEIPAVLVEVGYLTNAKERKKLTQKAYQNRLANQIHRALKDYAKNMDKLPSGILKPQNAKTR